MELGLNLFVPKHEVARWLAPSEEYGHFHKPNCVETFSYHETNVTWTARINGQGLRGPEFDPKCEDDKRILFVGDSFTFGYGLDEEFIFPTLTGRHLEGLFPGETWTVINAGVAGWGTHQQLKHAEANLDLFRPDVAVLTFCDNDLLDDLLFLGGQGDGLLPSFPGKIWLRDHSYFYRMLYRLFSDLLFERVAHQSHKADDDSKENEVFEVSDQSNPGGSDLLQPNSHLWPRTLHRIKEFHQKLKMQNPSALLIVQAAQPLRSDVFFELRVLDNGKDIRHLHLGLDVEKWEDRNVLLPYDPHWRKEVHELSAQRISELIRSADHR